MASGSGAIPQSASSVPFPAFAMPRVYAPTQKRTSLEILHFFNHNLRHSLIGFNDMVAVTSCTSQWRLAIDQAEIEGGCAW